MTPTDLIHLIESPRYHTSSEIPLQEAVARVLSDHGVIFEREVRLGATDRVDFMVGKIAIELKVDGNNNAIMRQLQRYAQSSSVDQIILVTTRTRHCSMPRALSGKPVHVALLQKGI